MGASELPEDSVHDPIDGSSAHTRAFTGTDTLKIFYYGTNDRQLHIGWIGHGDAARAVAGNELNRVVLIDRESHTSLVADDFHPIFPGTLVTDKAPRSTAGKAVFEKEAGTNRVFGLVEVGAVGTIAMSARDDTEHVLQQVELMRSKVVEITASTCYIGLKAPG